MKKYFVSRLLCFGAAFLTLTTWAAPSHWKVDLSKGESEISFEAIGQPSFLKVHGKGHGLRGNLEQKGNVIAGTGLFSVDSFETGIGLRDQHMKKSLEVTKFPVAKLVLDPLPAGALEKATPFRGMLELHGEKKNVTGSVKLSAADSNLQASFQFTVKLSDFQIEAPSFAKITIRDEIKVSVEGTFPFQNASDLSVAPR
jgi:polyisoprenoid-binding protein YceI